MIAFALTCLVVEITPGPNMTTLAALAIAYGRGAGLAAVAGVALGLALTGVGAALGLAVIVMEAPAIYEALRYAGAAFLLFLAWEAWRDADAPAEAAGADPRWRALFLRGLLTNLINPKAFMFYVAILPGFVRPAVDGSVMGPTLALVVIYVTIATLIHAAIVLAAARLGTALVGGGQLVSVRRGLAVLLAGVAVWMFVAADRG